MQNFEASSFTLQLYQFGTIYLMQKKISVSYAGSMFLT